VSLEGWKENTGQQKCRGRKERRKDKQWNGRRTKGGIKGKAK
jgi:hypothetical protein